MSTPGDVRPLQPPAPVPVAPPGAPDVAGYRTASGMSPDAHHWWDGVRWQSSEWSAPPLAARSPDGLYWWDGIHWRGLTQATSSTNGLAIASLVLGILWIYWIASILAVIFGHIALRQISNRRQGGHGLAVAGLVLGYIGIAVLVAVLVAVFVVRTPQPPVIVRP